MRNRRRRNTYIQFMYTDIGLITAVFTLLITPYKAFGISHSGQAANKE